MKTYTGYLTKDNMPSNGIFVFGSNTQGRHGKGSARYALDNFGAKYGQSSGLQGQSYAIVTKDLTKKVHPSIKEIDIKLEILKLYHFVEDNPDKIFYIAYSGTQNNLNGYTPKQMASMFKNTAKPCGIPNNIVFEENFSKLLNHENTQSN